MLFRFGKRRKRPVVFGNGDDLIIRFKETGYKIFQILVPVFGHTENGQGVVVGNKFFEHSCGKVFLPHDLADLPGSQAFRQERTGKKERRLVVQQKWLRDLEEKGVDLKAVNGGHDLPRLQKTVKEPDNFFVAEVLVQAHAELVVCLGEIGVVLQKNKRTKIVGTQYLFEKFCFYRIHRDSPVHNK